LQVNKPFRNFLLMALIVAGLTGCADWFGDEPSIADLPTLTPSPAPTGTPAVALVDTPTPFTPTVTPTVTLTPRFSPTPPLGGTSTPANPQTATAQAIGLAGDLTPIIEYFAAYPTEVEPGGEILLFWSAQDGSSAAVYRVNADGSPGRTWQVKLEDSMAVYPISAGRNEVYTLAVTNGLITVEQQVSIAVSCPLEWFFSPPPAEGCPNAEVSSTPVVTQEFQGGRMVWFEAFNQVVVLFDDTPFDEVVAQPAEEGEPVEEGEEGEAAEAEEPTATPPPDVAPEDMEDDEPEPRWLLFVDSFPGGEGEPGFEPPEGYLPPWGIFGRIWQDDDTIRERLGWAVAGEIRFDSTYQREFIDDEKLHLFFTDDVGAVIELDPISRDWLVVGHFIAE
jgi:hypothetical protein